ncbi:hypothetical protein M5D96_001931 [Drosophila gunungcola]|uniref:Uncharacterized protein n=1 Tax=Drosophila gunungcola TaxID=103775 RepID=A0A9P9YZ31_9MUSC|nr:hypothetical protein M5D96_001931 [Drosophila gunungcola]
MLPSPCYMLFNDYNIPFYSTSNGYTTSKEKTTRIVNTQTLIHLTKHNVAVKTTSFNLW